MTRRRPAAALAAALAAGVLSATPATMPGQQPGAEPPEDPAAPLRAAQPPGDADEVRVFIIPDMEGMAGTVFSREVRSGFDPDCAPGAPCLTSPDYRHFQSVLAADVNAAIAGAREAGAAAFAVNEGHGGNAFANLSPFELDSAAVLVRGWPKPLVMVTGLDESWDTIMFLGAHANAGSLGVMAHNFAVDTLTVNGVALNEVGINALIAGEMGVSTSLVSGDDVLLAETHGMIGDFEEVLTKIAFGRNAAATYTPAAVQERLRRAARRAVEREQAGEFAPFTLEKPYRVSFALRERFAEHADEVAALERYGLERSGPRSFRFETTDAAQIGHLMNDLELIVF